MKMSIRQTSQGFSFQGFYLLPIVILSPSLAIAPPVIAQSQVPQSTQSSPQVTQNIIYVNPQTGSDRPEQGSNIAPFKTITYAIGRAQAGQIIQLAYGTYSSATGEKFPIRVRPNVTLRGNEAEKGKGITIIGGGILLTGSGFPQNVVIALADRAELRGVTVTNPNPRGYGLWIENASPAIANNTFIDNQQDGALITGKSTAIVSTNQFFRNGTSGLAIEGEASPDIRGNLFQQTTFGMSIRQEATPQLTENTFTQNQNGILIQANAKPILRGNAIINNRNYGLTISDNAMPDLGKANDDGNNTFQGNGTFDIQNVSRNAVALSGNQLDSKRVKGNLQVANVRQPSNLFANSLATKPTASSPSPNITAPSSPLPKSDRFANINQQLEQQIASSQPMNFAPNLDTPPALVRNASSSLSNNFNSTTQANNPFWYEPVTSVIIRITPKGLSSPIPSNTEISSNLPPVLASPPSGEPVNQPIQIAPLSNTSFAPQNPPKYRVVVPVSSHSGVAQVRQIVPNAFASRLNGYLVVQIGAYSDRRIAEVQVSRLAQQGLSARIEAIKP
ncbi:parallel beta-helix repeat-containing protein [Pseudanabaena sp. ABRG5-3]|nr:parallel beta-helix repeat-containing protein [Pseudanabaena sp. ABRG5-3]